VTVLDFIKENIGLWKNQLGGDTGKKNDIKHKKNMFS
jgi:hypothetical protein